MVEIVMLLFLVTYSYFEYQRREWNKTLVEILEYEKKKVEK